MTTKKYLHQQCLDYVEERFKRIHQQMTDIQINLQSETKSSAGDKFETGRAMLQLEREKLGQQLDEVNKLTTQLYNIKLNQSPLKVCIGSLVYTSKANYYIAISVGAIDYNVFKYYVISPQTPIGLILKGKQVGDTITFKNESFTITKIC